MDSIREAYPPEKAVKVLPEVNKSLASIRAAAEMLKAFHGNLREIVNETIEPLSD